MFRAIDHWVANKKSVMAEENNYESNGQASFYGTYVYENEKKSQMT